MERVSNLAYDPKGMLRCDYLQDDGTKKRCALTAVSGKDDVMSFEKIVDAITALREAGNTRFPAVYVKHLVVKIHTANIVNQTWEEPVLYVVHELIEGDILEEIEYKGDDDFNLDTVDRICDDIESMLTGLHSMGYVYGDLRDVHIMRRTDGRFVLIDCFNVMPLNGQSRGIHIGSVVSDLVQLGWAMGRLQSKMQEADLE